MYFKYMIIYYEVMYLHSMYMIFYCSYTWLGTQGTSLFTFVCYIMCAKSCIKGSWWRPRPSVRAIGGQELAKTWPYHVL